MGELLSKKVLAEIEHRKAYQYGSMVSLTVAERDALVAHVRALEAERDTYKLQIEAPYKAAITSSLEFGRRAVESFRQRAIEAVRALFHNSEVNNSRWNLAIIDAVKAVESLPATSEKVDHAAKTTGEGSETNE